MIPDQAQNRADGIYGRESSDIPFTSSYSGSFCREENEWLDRRFCFWRKCPARSSRSDSGERGGGIRRAVRLLMDREEGMCLSMATAPGGHDPAADQATQKHTRNPGYHGGGDPGSIGYLLCRSLRNEIPDREIAAVLTQVLVDPGDSAFATPSKPVGPYYAKEVAEGLISSRGWMMRERADRGWRRVVPSPRPLEIVELHTIMDAVGHGHLVIAGGGGGIPVIRDEKGELSGVEAVIDKDLTACKLALATGAERFVILTDVPHVSTGFGSASERRIDRMRPPGPGG